MQRLFKNIGRYQGETIDIDSVLSEVEDLATRTGWSQQPIAGSATVPGYFRSSPGSPKHVYISAGIHGDEPAGPLSVLKLFQINQWPEHLNLWIIPCLNPGGFRLNRRENEEGIDLNRDFRAPRSNIIRAHTQWLDERPPFAFSLCLHEDWESNGFYLYELNPDFLPSLADQMIQSVEKVCPVDLSPTIEGRNAQNGVICTNSDLPKRPDWPEAFYLIHHKTRLTYTLEAPSDFLLPTRIHALAAGVQAALQQA